MVGESLLDIDISRIYFAAIKIVNAMKTPYSRRINRLAVCVTVTEENVRLVDDAGPAGEKGGGLCGVPRRLQRTGISGCALSKSPESFVLVYIAVVEQEHLRVVWVTGAPCPQIAGLKGRHHGKGPALLPVPCTIPCTVSNGRHMAMCSEVKGRREGGLRSGLHQTGAHGCHGCQSGPGQKSENKHG